MKQYRWLTALVVGAFLLAACGGMQAAVPDLALSEVTGPTYTQEWDGRGSDSQKCLPTPPDGDPRLGFEGGGWIHWVYATKGESTGAELSVDGTVYEPGTPTNANVYHFYTPYMDLEHIVASVTLFGVSEAPRGGGLVISDYCPGEPVDPGATLSVHKTAVAVFDREHDWDVDKSVSPARLYLYEDGTIKAFDKDGNPVIGSDGSVQWTVDVNYLGFTNTRFSISGKIFVANTSNAVSKTIVSISDELWTTIFDEDLGQFFEDDVLVPNVALGPCAFGDWNGSDFDEFVSDGITYDTVSDLLSSANSVLEPGKIFSCDYEENDLTGVEQGTTGFNKLEVSYSYTLLDELVSAKAEARANWEFKEPATQVDKDVDVTDYSDLLETLPLGQLLGSVTAPPGMYENPVRKFVYPVPAKTFTYEGFDECGDFDYDNTVKLTGDDGGFIADAEATLWVHVQCLVFKGETVTGAGEMWSKVRRAPRTWFEYTPYPEDFEDASFEADLIQGAKRNVVGEVVITIDGASAGLCFTLAEYPEGTQWLLDPNASSNVKIQPLATKPTAYLQPGGFSEKFTKQGYEDICVTVPYAAYGYAIHLDAGYWMPDPAFGP